MRYASYVYDAHAGLYHLQRRSYDPLTRQFLSRDPLRSDGNESPYQYCAGDPLAATDPWGLYVTASGERDDPEIYVPQTGYVVAKGVGSGHRGALGGDTSDLYLPWQGSLGKVKAPGWTGVRDFFALNSPGEFLQANLNAIGYLTGCPWAESPFGDDVNADMGFNLGLMVFDPAMGVRGGARAGVGLVDDVARGVGAALRGARGGAEPVRIGQIGEAANPASEIGPKTPFSINGRNRIADGRRPGAWYEVKNTRYASRTRQIQDYVDMARASKESFVLRLRKGTRVSGPLRQWHADPENPLTIEWWVP